MRHMDDEPPTAKQLVLESISRGRIAVAEVAAGSHEWAELAEQLSAEPTLLRQREVDPAASDTSALERVWVEWDPIRERLLTRREWRVKEGVATVREYCGRLGNMRWRVHLHGVTA